MRTSLLATLAALVVTAAGCASKAPATTSATPATDSATRTARARERRDTVLVKDPELERRVARLELRLIEKEAQVEDLQDRLADSREEIVRTMAKLRGSTSRAEAASGMAEADVAIQALRAAGGAQAPELAQANRLAQQSSSEFNKENFGGALYLANQAKTLAASGRARLAGGGRASLRAGETPFALPVRLRITSKGNVREGPGTSFAVSYAIDAGASVVGLSYTDDWVRITDDAGRSGWIFRALVARP